MTNSFKKIILLLLTLSLFSCQWFTKAGLPTMMWANFKIPAGTPAFQTGYKHGCSQILYARGNYFYRFRHGYQYDPRLSGNKEYRFGYKRGILFCFNYIVGGVYSADRYLFPKKGGDGGIEGAITAGNYNDTPDRMFSGLSFLSIPDGGLDGSYQLLGGGSASVFGSNPLWAGGSKGQLFGQ